MRSTGGALDAVVTQDPTATCCRAANIKILALTFCGELYEDKGFRNFCF